jgi:hypothetical protein
MTGRALLIGTLFLGLGVAGVTDPLAAQSDLEEEDVSAGEVSEETSSTDFGSEDTFADDHWADDPFSPDTNEGIPRPRTPVRPDH